MPAGRLQQQSPGQHQQHQGRLNLLLLRKKRLKSKISSPFIVFLSCVSWQINLVTKWVDFFHIRTLTDWKSHFIFHSSHDLLAGLTQHLHQTHSLYCSEGRQLTAIFSDVYLSTGSIVEHTGPSPQTCRLVFITFAKRKPRDHLDSSIITCMHDGGQGLHAEVNVTSNCERVCSLMRISFNRC